MDLIPDDFALSCTEDPTSNIAFENVIDKTVRISTPLNGHRILRIASARRRFVPTSHHRGAPRDLPLYLHASPRPNIRSASTDPWSTSGFVEDESAMDRSSDEPEDFNSLIEPKIEAADDDVRMDDLLEADESSTTPPDINGKAVCRTRRPRGRPRKNPAQGVEVSTKVQKGRSKTGCITCRRRKKKCDETKPSCLNCEKNAVICEGYPDRTYWKSGKDKGEVQLRRTSLPNSTLAPIIHGVSTPGDRIFFEHYCFRLSAVLTVEGPTKNAFKDMLLPMAIQHLGLMHSILALSSTHIDYQEPYGQKLLRDHPEINEKILRERSQYHKDEALKEFNLDIQRQREGRAEDSVLSIRYGQMLCLVVQSIAEGKATGEHRIHLKAYQDLVHETPHDEGPFMEFIEEYFQFHIGLDDIISFPQGSARLGAITDDFSLPNVIQPEAVRLLGVQDGLFFYMSKITSIRNTIRSNMERGIDPVVDYTSLYRAIEIDAGINLWRPSWSEGESRDLAGALYRYMMWIYLYRTIYPPKTLSWRPEYKITEAVDKALEILKEFDPKGQVQTLLLAPTFIVGCAAFDPAQRAPIRRYIANIKDYTHLKNADRSLEVLEQVWRYMDDKDERSWDWQSVAHSMGMDFLAT